MEQAVFAPHRYADPPPLNEYLSTR